MKCAEPRASVSLLARLVSAHTGHHLSFEWQASLSGGSRFGRPDLPYRALSVILCVPRDVYRRGHACS